MKSLKTLIRLQNVILAYVALYALFAVITRFVPISGPTSPILLPIFLILIYSLLAMIPLALVVLALAIKIFAQLAKTSSVVAKKAKFASWFSVFAGLYILGYFAFYAQLSLWATQISHELVVAAQSSAPVVGLALLASHVYTARSSFNIIKANA